MKTSVGIAVLLAVFMMAPVARAEDYPPSGWERFTVYYTGTCGVSKTYNGH